MKCLLVGDAGECGETLEPLWRHGELEILQARSSGEALEILLLHDVALAILDADGPDANASQLARLMRGAERTRRVPILLLGAESARLSKFTDGDPIGAIDFLFKPIDPAMLCRKVDVFLQLHRQRVELDVNLRVNEVLAGVLGCDLRTPLGSILAGTRLLEQRLADERLRPTLDRMISSAKRIKEMADQLLELTRARLGSGLGLLGRRRTFDVGGLVRAVVDELGPTAPDRVLTVVASGDGRITGDRLRVLQLFSNLISDALLHGRPGTPITVSVDGAGDREAIVAVRREGAISDDRLARLFDPFRPRGRSAPRLGRDIGLYVSQQIAIAHGGRIEVESTESHGTVFRVVLPRGRRSEKAAGDIRQILIVDDQDEIREVLREAFEDAGYATETAPNGREAFERLADGSIAPDVVVLDLEMPVLDGTTLYRLMQQDDELSRIPVVVSTSMLGAAPEGVRVLPKPVDLGCLLDTVAELCGSRGPERTP